MTFPNKYGGFTETHSEGEPELMPKLGTELEPEDDEFNAARLPELKPERVESRRLYFYPLPRYHEDGRFDPRARGELEAALPATEDYEDRFSKIAAPGWYAVELRRGSKIADSWALEVRPDERRIELEDDDMPLPVITPQGITGEDIALIVDRALAKQEGIFNRMFEEQKAAQQSAQKTEPVPPKQSDQFRDMLGVLKEMQQFNASSEPKRKEPPADQFKTFLEMFDRVREIQERVNLTDGVRQNGARGESKSISDRVINMFERNPVMQSRAIKTYDRLIDKLLPEDGEGDDNSMTREELQAELIEFLMEKCEANMPITFEDEQVKAFKDALPEEWDELMDSLSGVSLSLLLRNIATLSPPRSAEVLSLPHAREWVRVNLQVPAVALRKDEEISGS